MSVTLYKIFYVEAYVIEICCDVSQHLSVETFHFVYLVNDRVKVIFVWRKDFCNFFWLVAMCPRAIFFYMVKRHCASIGVIWIADDDVDLVSLIWIVENFDFFQEKLNFFVEVFLKMNVTVSATLIETEIYVYFCRQNDF